MNQQSKNPPTQSNFSDYEVSMLLIERDACHYRAERIEQLLTEIGKTKGIDEPKNERIAISENFFSELKFEPQKGTKLGDYEVAYRANNVVEVWDSVHQILEQANAKIDSRYHGPNYSYSYWLYETNKIYRQRLKAKV